MINRETTNLTFDVDAALLDELGERLVARRSIAIAELIKNAYDADATEATVSFKNVTTSRGEIIVADNGSGMTLETMKNGWMRIATTDAVANPQSKKFGRPKTGAKGLGRFACRRLASCLSLESTSNGSAGNNRIKADFDWRNFQAGQDLSNIQVEVTHETAEENATTGTTLRFTALTDTWKEQDIAEIRTELGELMDPLAQESYIQRSDEKEPDPGFRMRILAPEFPTQEGSPVDRFMDVAWGVLRGQVTEQGNPEYVLNIRDGEAPLNHAPSAFSFPDLSGATFTIRMMVYSGNRFRTTGFSLAQARTFGRERGGVRIYLDGFQVFSYGSPGDDWLSLDQDGARRLVRTPEELQNEAEGLRRPMLALPGNMQLFGAVAISRERNPGIAVSISRERLVQNETFEHLKRFVRAGIDWMTVCYARDLAKSRRDRGATAGSTPTPVQALRTARDLIRQELSIPGEKRAAIESSLSDAESLLSVEREAYISELSMLRVLASAGTTVLVFDHTLRAMAGQLLDVVDRLEVVSNYLADDHQTEFQQTLEDLRSWSSMATGQGSLVGLLVSPEARSRSASHAVHPLVESLRRGFQGYTALFGINFENAVPPTVRTPPMHQAELYAVLLNVLTNSFKSVREMSERAVCVEASANPQELIVRVHDTGTGVPLDIREEVFEPFVTTSQPDPVLGVGTGLGLKIVRDLTRSWGGDAYFVNSESPWRTTIELLIPHERGA